jgi:hypothetical protein
MKVYVEDILGIKKRVTQKLIMKSERYCCWTCMIDIAREAKGKKILQLQIRIKINLINLALA